MPPLLLLPTQNQSYPLLPFFRTDAFADAAEEGGADMSKVHIRYVHGSYIAQCLHALVRQKDQVLVKGSLATHPNPFVPPARRLQCAAAQWA